MIFRVVSALFFDMFFMRFSDRCWVHFWSLWVSFSDVCSALFSHVFSVCVFGGLGRPRGSKKGPQRGSKFSPKSAQNRAWRRNLILMHFETDLGSILGPFGVNFGTFSEVKTEQ